MEDTLKVISNLAQKMAKKASTQSGKKYLESDKKVMTRNRRLTGKPNANVRNYRRYLSSQDQGLYADLPKATPDQGRRIR